GSGSNQRVEPVTAPGAPVRVSAFHTQAKEGHVVSSHRAVSGSRFFKRLVTSLALCVLPALAREAPAAEIWVYPSANTTWAISGDYTVTNDATTRFDWSYPDNAAPTTASPSGTDPKVKLAFIPQVTGAVS